MNQLCLNNVQSKAVKLRVSTTHALSLPLASVPGAAQCCPARQATGPTRRTGPGQTEIVLLCPGRISTRP
jgi:hypothetical protein